MLANGENKKHAAADGVRINLKVKSQTVDVSSYALGVFGCFAPVWMLFDPWFKISFAVMAWKTITFAAMAGQMIKIAVFIDAIWCEAVMSLNGCDEDETIRILAGRPTMVAAMADIMMVISVVMGCDGSNGFNKDVYVSDFILPILLLRLLAYGGRLFGQKAADCQASSKASTKFVTPEAKPLFAKRVRAIHSGVSSDVAELKDMVRALLLDKQTSPVPAPAPVKAVEQSCVTCGGAYSYRNCPATDSNNYQDNIQEYISQAAAANFNQGNSGYRPPPMANQIRPPGFPPMQHNSQANNQNRWNQIQNRGNGYNQGQIQRPQVQQQAPMYQPPVNQHPTYQARQASGVSKTDFESYVKANDAVVRIKYAIQMSNITDLLTKIVITNPALYIKFWDLFLVNPTVANLRVN
ncbi:hypothetical protein Tco_1313621 [Tanacetum coccineum]